MMPQDMRRKQDIEGVRDMIRTVDAVGVLR